MTKSGKEKEYTRKTFKGRWQMIREVRLPDGYTTPGKPYWRGGQKHDSSPKPVNVAPHITQAVLLDLAQWDFPGSTIYKGIGNIVHGTKLSHQAIGKAIAVLHEAGIQKRIRRGLNETSVSVLDWDRIEALREPFRPEYEKDSITNTGVDAEDDDVPELRVKAPVDDAASADDGTGVASPSDEMIEDPVSELIDLIMSFRPYQRALSRYQLKTVAAALLKNHSLGEVKAAYEGLEDRQKAMAVAVNNPAGYLRKMLENALVLNKKLTADLDKLPEDPTNDDDLDEQLKLLAVDDLDGPFEDFPDDLDEPLGSLSSRS